MKPDDRVWIAGATGLVGSAIVRRLRAEGFASLILRDHDALDLRDPSAVEAFVLEQRPTHVFLAAGLVGGIMANVARPADFLTENLAMELAVIQAAHRADVQNLLFLGSSCAYPKHAPQPIREEHLLSGELEPTNRPYAIAKIAGIEMCDTYRRQFGRRYFSVMPTNLYGPNDNFDLETSHVLPALIRRFHEAEEHGLGRVTLWGSGNPRREFLHVDDLADACVFLMRKYQALDLINIGAGKDIPIRDLAQMVARIVGWQGEIEWDGSRPDGMERKLLDVSRLGALGWRARVSLEDGIRATYAWYRETVQTGA